VTAAMGDFNKYGVW